MAGTIAARLAALGITLPQTPPPAGNYVPTVVSGNLVFVSGQIPFAEGKILFPGKLGETVSLEDGQLAARQCFINILAQVQAAVEGELDRVRQVVKLGGFVASAPSFTQHPAVINGASDLAVAVFGEAGRHARAAVGVACLPLDCSVEIDAIFEIE